MMKEIRLFRCVVDDGVDAFVSYLASDSKESLLSKYSGNGEFLKVEDVTGELFGSLKAVDNIRSALEKASFRKPSITFVCALLEQYLTEVLHVSEEGIW